ncbi:porin [Kaistia sp. 32K]|uniref:outer membrane protein n=1 Tax=Kaistia sp. 32K TaxID=2795690 RepID=UPI00191689D8|nr:outer membrane protein [Kaistia sp. 32K]BCP52799.1 porin [Kaistia sp. 32K]
MKTLGLGIVLALGMAGAAQAADLTAAPPEPVPAPAFSWTGLYLGGHAGYGWGDFTSDPTDAYGGLKPDGFFGGGQVGYNYQFDNRLVLGVEADVSFGSLKDDIDTVIGDPSEAAVEIAYSTKIDTFGTVRGRLGYAADRFLPYVTGGLAWARADLAFSNTITVDGQQLVHNAASNKQTYTGWTIGAGVEYAVTNNITAKLDYLYADLGSRDFDLGTPVQADLKVQTVQVGLNYKF